MRKLFFTLFTFFVFSWTLTAQLVWTDPVFPTAGQPVTIYFDAAKGTGGLANCACDVYIHTGLITSKSNSPSDWKYTFTQWGLANNEWKMTPVAGRPNVYSFEIQPSIKERYQVTDPNEVIQKLAMVFRNANGTKEGKDVGGTDIFYDVYPENQAFSVTLIAPASPAIFAQIGAVLPVQGAASQPADLALYDNGNLIAGNTGITLSHNLMVSSTGAHLVQLIGDNGTSKDTASFTYVAPGATTTAELPAGTELGINYLTDTSALLALYAPNKKNIYLLGDFNSWQFQDAFQLKKTSDGNTWWIQVDGLTPGKYYAFQYVVDGTIRIGDPYSNIILDPSNDQWIPADVFPDMPPYPVGKTTGIVSLLKAGATAYPWQNTNFVRPKKGNLTIYEMLMRDFFVNDYQKLTGMLDYFTGLGVNAIELMPVNEFDGNNSWGYNPTFHYALDKAYGTPEAFKAFVDACHARGIAVIIDVVFNHAHEKNPLCQLYWDAANFRPAADNPWLNPQAPHDFSVFFDFNHESEATRTYVKKTLRHYLTEYNVDGFRFDLSKGFTQNVSGPFDAGAYDAKRIATLKIYADEIWSVSPDAYVILEHFAANSEETELSNYGAMFWSGFGPHNQYIEAAMGYPSDLNGASYKTRGWKDPHLIAYMESHDEERIVYKSLKFGNSLGNYNTRNLPTALDRVELASTFFYTIPGPKMLWQFGELGYDFPINLCPNGTESNNCRTDPKPIRLDYAEQPDRLDVFNVVRSLLTLRNNYEVFQTADFQLSVTGPQKVIRLNHATMNVDVLGNFAMSAANITPNFQHTGWWYDYFTGDSLNVSDVAAPINLQAGEYRLYTDVRLQKPDFFTDEEKVMTDTPDWTISPNPSNGHFQVRLNLAQATRVELAVFDLQGRRLATIAQGNQPSGRTDLDFTAKFRPGVYLLRLVADGAVDTKKIVIVE